MFRTSEFTKNSVSCPTELATDEKNIGAFALIRLISADKIKRLALSGLSVETILRDFPDLVNQLR